MKILVVVDMQKDFIDGALGTPEAIQIVPYVKKVIESFEGKVLFTRDTHFEDYMDTQEGRNLPVKHCIRGTPGWEIHPDLEALRKTPPIDKRTFGSSELPQVLAEEGDLESVIPGALHRHLCNLQCDARQSLFPGNPVDCRCSRMRRCHPSEPQKRSGSHENVSDHHCE